MRQLPLCGLVLVATIPCFSSFSYAEDTLSFSFSPPPITRPGEQVNKLGFNFTSLEYETTDVDGNITTTDFSLFGMNMLTKNNGGFFAGSLVSGSDEQDITRVTGLNFNGGGELKSESGFAMSVGLGFNLIYVVVDMTDSANYFYSETTMTTMQLDFALQQRIALGDSAGITPYISMAYVMMGSGTTDTTVVVLGNSYTSSTEVEVDPYVSTQIGLDIDFAGMSLAAMVQESDNTSITSLNFGFEF